MGRKQFKTMTNDETPAETPQAPPVEPPLTVGALEVILLLLHPTSNLTLHVPVARMRAAAEAADQLRAWAAYTLDQALKAQASKG